VTPTFLVLFVILAEVAVIDGVDMKRSLSQELDFGHQNLIRGRR
jgi:hypothetical protein